MATRLMIAGTNSGVGKTTIAAGLIAALTRRGEAVQPFKVGPDYIDPGYHSAAAGRPCRNLDTWLVPPDRVAAMFRQRLRAVDAAVIEGVMGVFDGRGYDQDAGSSAAVAKLLSTPVVLVIDASRMARSAGAIALGYQQFDADLPLAGFIVNRVGSESHGHGVSTAIEQATGLPVFGWIPRDERAAVPERHLGLVPTAEASDLNALAERLADLAETYIDIDQLQQIAAGAGPLDDQSNDDLLRTPPVIATGAKPVVAVAQDAAFHFTYEENLELLTAAGAELRHFSPLQDDSLPANTTGVMISGGFPELFAEDLAANTAMRDALRRLHAAGVPIYAECGGLMYLTEAILDKAGREHPMIGLLPGRSSMSERLTLGYREATAMRDSWLFFAGEVVRGHEFHYSAWDERPSDLAPAFHIQARRGSREPRDEGACLGNLWASYVHLHFAAMPALAQRFVAACRQPEVVQADEGSQP